MSGGIEAFEGIVCGFRPEGSVMHLVALVAFVVFAWWLSPSRRSAR